MRNKCRTSFRFLTKKSFSLLFCAVVLAFASFAEASPATISFQMKIFKPNGTPLENTNNAFRFTLTDPSGSCVLYIDDHTNVNLAGTKGQAFFQMGSGIKTYASGGGTFGEIFSNSSALSCQSGGTYTPGATDSRKLVVQFNDGSGWQTLPSSNITSVPYALVAGRIGNKTAADLFSKSDFPSCSSTQALSFNGTSFSCISASSSGSGSLYGGYLTLGDASSGTTGSTILSSGSTGGGNNATGSVTIQTPNVATGAASANAGNINIQAGNGGGSSSLGGAVNITAGSGGTTGNNNGSDVVINPGAKNGSGSDGNIILGSLRGLVGIGTTAPASPLHVHSSGNAGIQVSSSTGSASLILNAVSSGSPWSVVNSGRFRIYDHSMTTFPLTIEASVGYANESSIYVKGNGNVGIGTAAPAYKLDVTGDVNVTGNFKVNGVNIASGGGTVSSVSSANTDISVATGTSTPVLTLNSGTGANQIVKLDCSAKLPALDGSQLTNILPSQTGHNGKVLQTNGTTTSWTTPSSGTVTSVSSANSYISVTSSSTTPVITANVGTSANTLAAGDDSRITGALQLSSYNTDVTDPASCLASEKPYWNTVSDKWMCTAIGSLNASTITAGTISSARLGSGTADSSTYLRGDGTWATPSGAISGLSSGYLTKAASATTIGNSVLYETGGNLGIGTTSPSEKLEISGTTVGGLGGSLLITNTREETNSWAALKFKTGNSQKGTLAYVSTGSWGRGDFRFLQNSVDDTSSATTSNTVMIIRNTGLVGIGTTAPSHRLTVTDGTTTPLASVSGASPIISLQSGSSAVLMARDNTNSIEFLGGTSTSGYTFVGSMTNHDFAIRTFNADRLSVKNSGLVGINTTSPGARLDVTDTSTTTSALIVPRAATFTGTTANGMIRYNTSSSLFEFYENGAWVNYTTVSDGRLKSNVEPVTNGLSLVQQLRPVFYDWNQNHPKSAAFKQKHQVGFIAQEVEQVLPEVVNVGEDNYRSLEYGKMVAVAIAAIKDLAQQVFNIDENQKDLEQEVVNLKKENEELKLRLERIEKALGSK